METILAKYGEMWLKSEKVRRKFIKKHRKINGRRIERTRVFKKIQDRGRQKKIPS